MRTSLISTVSLNASPRTNLALMQQRLSDASKEVATGRHADTGLALGDRTGRTVSLRRDLGSLEAMIGSNGLASARLEKSQSALADLGNTVETMQRSLVGLPDSVQAIDLLKRQASAGLAMFTSTMNTNDGRSYVFAGTNTGVAPMADYSAAPKTAVDAALSARFGLNPAAPQDDAAGLAAITPADMSDFLDNEFADLFDDTAWKSTWSQASDTPQRSRISQSETVETSVTANASSFRGIAKALAMIADTGIDHLSANTRQVVIEKAREVIGGAYATLVNDRSWLGVSQERVEAADTRMRTAKDIVEQRISGMESVDPVEAKVEIDQLSTQIEMSYSLTAKILRMSIMNYA